LNAIKYPVWVGEWSLATDVCALWLGGFNDGNHAYEFECALVDCPAPYVTDTALVPDVDRTVADLGPWGSKEEIYTITNGQCRTDSTFFGDADIKTLGGCAIAAWDEIVDGHFMWTFRNELEPRWNYITAYDNGWLTSN